MILGFVDYYLSEWHADHYPEWIREAVGKLGIEASVKYAWAKKNVSPVTGLTTEQWCEANGVEVCATVGELCEKCDAVIILAPSDPEVHFELCKAVFPFKKPTFVDKTFAPDLKTAREIFAEAEKWGTPFFTSSALRYSEETEFSAAVKTAILTGGGSNFNEYIIHPLEMTVKTFGVGAKAVCRQRLGASDVCRIVYPDGRNAVINYAPAYDFTICAETENGWEFRGVTSDFFPKQMETALRFFAEPTAPFDPAETLEIMKIREALIHAPDGEPVAI